MTDNPPAGLGAAIKNSLRELTQTFAAFLKAPRALWGVNIPYVFEGLVYFGILTILGKYCSENVALNDIHSGWVYGGVTGGITFAMLLFGGVSDKIGVRVSLALSLAVMMLGRVLVALSGTLSLGSGMGSPMFLLMAAGLLLMVSAYGLYMPAAYAGVKRYTNPQTAAIGYAVIYGLMNLGAFLSGFVSSNTRHAFVAKFPPNGLTAVFWIYSGITLFGSLLTLLIISRKVDRQAVERVGPRNPADEHRRAEPGRRRQGRRGKEGRGARSHGRLLCLARPRPGGAGAAHPLPPGHGSRCPAPFSTRCWRSPLGRGLGVPAPAPRPPLPRRPLRLFHLHPHPGADALRPQLADHPLLP